MEKYSQQQKQHENKNEKLDKCDIYASHCYEKFCPLISSNKVHNFMGSLCTILTDNYRWTPTKFCVKLLDILVQKASNISSILIVQEILEVCWMSKESI